jgi:uncharacterized protein
VQFNEESSADQYRVRAFRKNEIEIQYPRRVQSETGTASVRLQPSFILAPDALVLDWSEKQLSTLSNDDLAAISALNPEVLLLGSGAELVFPAPELNASLVEIFMRQGIGVEIMTNESVCRTYNILAHELRRVVAALTR